jgi:hypothetical protein
MRVATFMRRIAAYARVVTFDERGLLSTPSRRLTGFAAHVPAWTIPPRGPPAHRCATTAVSAILSRE